MKNLKLLCHKWRRYVDVDSVRVIIPLCDSTDEIIISDNSRVFKINIVTEEFNLLFDLENEIPLSDVYIVNIAFFSIERILLCAVNTGEVMRLDMESLLVDAAGCFEKGIKAMQVSPDNEQLVFVTGDNKVILADCRLEVINTVSLDTETFGDGEFMTVGWGKKETQFHGSEGKEAAKQKTVIEETGDVIKKDDVLITWRGDGALFAVGFCMSGVYSFKVFDREVVLKFTSEKQAGIECNFAWRPMGNLIATTQQFPNKYVVAFFEKNGLKHGEFVLPFMKSDVSVKKLSWSADSEVLSVWCEESAFRQSFLLNYTVNNYHWYLKQSLVFPADCSISAMAWDDSNSSGNGKLLYVFLNGGIYSQYNWVWCTDASTGKTEKDNAIVSVVDGKNILLTLFRKAVIPPPMAALTLICNTNVNQIIFAPNSVIDNTSTELIDSNSFMALLDDGSFNLYIAQTQQMGSGFKLLGSASLKENIQTPRTLSHFLWLANNTIMCVSSNGSKSDLLLLAISCNDKFDLNLVRTVPIAGQIVGLSRITNTEAMVQTSSGKLFTFSEANGLVEYHFSFPECCYQFEVCSLPGESSTVFLFGMTIRHRFYIDDKEVANNVNSFFVHSDFLLLTTLQHQLLCCPLSKDMNIRHFGSHFENKGGNNVNTTVSQRKLERGSELITAVACDSRTVLQLPRGNIEAIQPRALSLKLIGNFLDKCEYIKAFDLMRKQRINLNLIYDHDPEKFTKNIPMFISEIDNASWLSLFITDLEDVDVTETMYASSYNRPKVNNNGVVCGKISLICATMMRYLQQDNERNKNVIPILTARVKANTRLDLEGALLMIRMIQLQPGKGDDETLISADEAMKYLLLLVDVNSLYDIALGLYDFDLVMFVASKSQKDPKEYVPYLNELKKMHSDYQKFTINKHLKRYDRALECLVNYVCNLDSESDVEKELMSFIKQHNLYKDALHLFSLEEHPLFQQCAEDFADYLIARRKYSEAGIMYKRSGHLKKAVDAFTEAVDWQAVMNLVEDLDLSDEELKELQSKLMEKLKENKRYSEALELLSYSNKATPEELLSCTLEGQLYRKALNICKRFKRTDLIEGTLLDALVERYSVLMSTIKDKQEQFLQQRDRLQVVRKIKAEMVETGEDLHEDCDLFSDKSSVAQSSTSRSSRGSMRSSKNRRKHQRKLVSLKEGSRYEDIALVRSLHSLATTAFALRHDVSEINFVLQWLEKDSQVDDLQTRLKNTLKEMETSFPHIWLPELSSVSEVDKADDSQDTSATDEIDSQLTLEPHIRIAPVIQEIKWTVELF